jgi:predicted aspartyl protease
MRVFAFVTIIPVLLLGFAAEGSTPLGWDATGHMLAPILVNGSGPYPFILDTGADASAVYQWFAAAHGLRKGHSEQLSGAVGSQAEVTTMIDRLSLDGRTIDHVDADTIPDRPDGAKIAGVAGVDLMTDRLAILDTGCATVALLPEETNPAKVAGAHATLINAGGIRDGKQLTMPISINGVKGVATLDTGARITMINRKFAHAAGVDSAAPSFKDGPAVRGAASQTVPSRIGPIGSVEFAGLIRDKPIARVVDLPFFADPGFIGGLAANIGLDLLHNARLTIDYRHRKFWVAESLCKS